MKKIFTVLAAVIFTASVFAQAPQKMNYQAVVRDASNKLVTNHTVGMRISILQTTPTGTAVYVETQTPTTNANGLVSIAVGNGSLVSGTFASINWANGPYFIKTESDPTGGTSYTITGTSQILSVPYALHANIADSVKGGETEPLYNASVAKNITASDTANWTASISTHKIGDNYGGGIVFAVYDNGQHGLIADTADLGPVVWYNGSNTTTSAFRDGFCAGKSNTDLIIANQGAGSYAAMLCNNLNHSGYGDWYLPSIHELLLLQQQQNVVGGFTQTFYYSSTEDVTNNAQVLTVHFTYYTTYQSPKNDATYHTRAIRAF